MPWPCQARPAGSATHWRAEPRAWRPSATTPRENLRLGAEAPREPATAEIGEDAGRLVKQKERGEHERRVTERVEMQQHQHAQGAVGQRKAPVAPGNDQIVADAGHHTPRSITILAKSTMWQ